MPIKSNRVLMPLIAGLCFFPGYSGVFQALGQSATCWFNVCAKAELRKLEIAGLHKKSLMNDLRCDNGVKNPLNMLIYHA